MGQNLRYDYLKIDLIKLKSKADEKKRVLILCTGNFARSQMAEGLLRQDAGEKFEVESAGVSPSNVRPEAIEVMNEIGIDISAHRSKAADEFVGQNFDFIITICDNAKETCPFFPAIRRGFTRALKIRRCREWATTNRAWQSSGACAMIRGWSKEFAVSV